VSLISEMSSIPQHGYIQGKCANCHKSVYEALSLLDDAYNVWLGKCPECKALNFLAMSGLRGYSSAGMNLVLPTDEEKAENNLPSDCPTSGPSGRPATAHGTIAGELYHQMTKKHAP
jgi:phage FluMu protein Com